MIFKRESKRMLKKQIAKLDKLGWTLDEDSDYVVCFRKTGPRGKVHALDICHKRDVDTKKELPAVIFSYEAVNACGFPSDAAVSLTAPEAWAAIGIAVAKGWRAMK